jgi:hypothetical protein
VSGDSESNANGPRFLEILRIAFGADNSGSYECLLNSSGANRGLPTRVEGHHKSIIDFLVCAPSGQSRVTNVHVETKNQLHGANGCGSDHNLVLLDWKLWNSDNASTNPKRQTPSYRLCWDKDALGDPAVAALCSSILTPGLSTWHNALSDLLQSSPDFLASLNLGARQVLTDGMYASWSFLVHDALCHAVPVKAVGRRSKEWWDPDLQKLLDKRRAAHASLTAYCNTMQYNTLEPFSADSPWQELWSTYAQLRKEAHVLIQSNKADKWQNLVAKLESEFDTDKRFFFATIQRICSARSGKKASSIPSLQVPLTSAVPNPGSVTSDPEEIKQILFEFQSGLCK